MDSSKTITLRKTNLISTDLIRILIEKLNLTNTIDETVKRFINIPFDKNKLSLTHNQNIKNQLRFYNKDYAFEIINNLAIKISRLLKQKYLFKIYANDISEIELFLFKRLHELNKKIHWEYIYTLKKEQLPKISYKNMRYFQNIGDNWTAKLIGNILAKSADYWLNYSFWRDYSFVFLELGDPLASQKIIEYIINSVNIGTSSEDNEALINSYYLLGLLYSRNLPKPFQNLNKSMLALNEAYTILKKDDFIVPNKEFRKVFNRNGYALLLFYTGQYEETITLLNELIAKIEKIALKHSFAKLHLTVLHYNLFQVYNAIDMNLNAENEIKQVITLDPNDVEYKYDYIRFLFKLGKTSKFKEMLDFIAEKNIGNLVYQYSYYGQYYYLKEEYKKASYFCKKAWQWNFEADKNNKLLFNYIVNSLNAGLDIPKELKKHILPNSDFTAELLDLLGD